MIIVMRPNCTQIEIEAVLTRLEALGFDTYSSTIKDRTVITIVGSGHPQVDFEIEALPGVEKTIQVEATFKLASRNFSEDNTVVDVCGVRIGGSHIAVIAGPCAVESRQQMLEIAHAVKEAGANMLRGGAFKPRTSPFSFQGLGEQGLEILAEARSATGLPIVTEVMNPEQVPIVSKYVDMLQVGSRSMQNYALLRRAGESGRPVLLKRGMMATIDEWLMAADYILACGNLQLVLCERGIRTFEKRTRNTTDINAIPVIKQLSHLPIILDPSHATGQREYVTAIASAAIAAGADGLIVEVHTHPDRALSDGIQSLLPETFARLVETIRRVATAIDRDC